MSDNIDIDDTSADEPATTQDAVDLFEAELRLVHSNVQNANKELNDWHEKFDDAHANFWKVSKELNDKYVEFNAAYRHRDKLIEKTVNNKIVIAKDFSRWPVGGGSSGIRPAGQFRDNLLAPRMKEAIDKDEYLAIDMDGIAGATACFFGEVFGGLVRVSRFPWQQVLDRLVIISNEMGDRYADEIRTCIYDTCRHKEVRAVAAPVVLLDKFEEGVQIDGHQKCG